MRQDNWWNWPYSGGSQLEQAQQHFIAEAGRLITRAVTEWAEQAGLTVERWLEFYEPHLETKTGETPTVIILRVTARLKGESQIVLPEPRAAYVGDGHPDVRRARYQREPEELPE